MLRKRSRATRSKQGLGMGDYGTVQSPPPPPTTTEDKFRRRSNSSSLFTSPRFNFTGFVSKCFTDTESAVIMSPTSILDTKPQFSALKNPFWSEPQTLTLTPKSPNPESKNQFHRINSKGIGLGIVDALSDDELSDSKPETRMVMFGSRLKIQIPPLNPPPPPNESPISPADFGIKTRNPQLGFPSPGLSHSLARKSPIGSANSNIGIGNSPNKISGCLSASEMELSEDYTCVISHGPNPRTTHIFGDCVVESCCGGGVGLSGSRKDNGFSANRSMSYPSESFLSFCYSCKRNLGLGRDIFMYRGEKAFCSSECRQKEMILEEEMEILETENAHKTCP